MHLGLLAAIWRYPIKSLAGESLAEGLVRADGIDGDRERALVVRDGHPRKGKTYRGKENARLHTLDGPEAALASAREGGVTAQLELDEDERFFDDAPISLIVDRWLDGLSEHVGYAVEYQRFRPNFFVRASGPVPLEAALAGLQVQLGEVMLRVRYPIERCVVTTYDPNGGEADPRILRYVAAERSTWMGIYCDVLRAGIVRIDDEFELVDR
ncbi:MAG TPA: MOSC N-terminal beta barrel domain-containing protein [Candidatus Baltobacteraceae bacterium]|nr:MOSC N-terminal beta barrel domain-containing protein [Candidatus Baltobacteraceae bacterium]